MDVVFRLFKSLNHSIGGLKQQKVVNTLLFIFDREASCFGILVEVGRGHTRPVWCQSRPAQGAATHVVPFARETTDMLLLKLTRQRWRQHLAGSLSL